MENAEHQIWFLGDRDYIESLTIESLHENFRWKHIAKLGFLENWHYHFNVTLGVNIYERAFDREKRLLEINAGRFKILIIRYEDIHIWNEILSNLRNFVEVSLL